MAQITTVSETLPPPITTGKYYFLKGRFKSAETNLFGLFVIFFNPQKAMETFHLVATSYSNIYDIEPHHEWHRFEEMITEHRWKGTYNNSMTASLNGVLDGVAKDIRQKDELYGLVSTYNYSRIEIVIFDLFNRMVRDKDMVLETGIQEATPEEVQHARNLQKEQKEEQESRPIIPTRNFKVEEGAIVISTSMVLSPVRGKLLYELKIGDRIMMKIDPNSSMGAHYIELYKLITPEGKMKGVPAEVIDIRSDSKTMPVDVLARIDEGIYGRATEEERHVRVSLYDPRVDGAFKKMPKQAPQADKQKKMDKASYSSMTYLMLGFLAFLFMVLFFILYLAL